MSRVWKLNLYNYEAYNMQMEKSFNLKSEHYFLAFSLCWTLLSSSG